MNRKTKLGMVPAIMTGSLANAKAEEAEESTGIEIGNLVVGEYEAASTRLTEMAETPEGREAASSLLEWIDRAEMFHLPWVNWVLVAAGIALFGSHLGQLVFGKLWVGLRGGGWSVTESLNDALVAGFALLALPVVMTIPIGAEAFVDRPLAVLSSVAVGLVMALILYFHGVRQESLAVQGKCEPKGTVSAA